MRLVCTVGWGLGLVACGQEAGIRQPLPPVDVGLPLEVGPEIQVDRVLQVVPPTVDLLWVLDSSGSMLPYREAMAQAFPSFIEPFESAGLDYHIGVTTTNVNFNGDEGRLQTINKARWVQPDDPNPILTFQRMAVDAIQHHNHDEKGLAATILALVKESRPGGYNEGFLRRDPSVWLHVNVMSDEDDQSAGYGKSASQKAAYRALFLEEFWRLKPNRARASFNSIVAFQSDVDYSVRGTEYLAISADTGGLAYDLLEGDWDLLMDELGVLQAPPVAYEFFLSRLPVIDTLDVRAITADGVTIIYRADEHFVYQEPRNSVLFFEGEEPPIGAEVRLTYEVRATRTL